MFNISAQQDEDGTEVLMVASGPAGVPQLCAAISFLAELLQRTGRRVALMDMMGLDFTLDEAGDRAVLQHLLKTMPPLHKLAIVVPAGTSHGLLAAAASARGVAVGEFDNLPDAHAWLGS